ncbi:DNA methyltransferase [Enterococcus faecium]|uniref:DNA methyltransferase n=1 Tax=Enterococcus faecium TaxID=1352 RepID=UPI0020903BFE|nr:DNA methyltransferase [Enterococcus faecium]MCO5442405.1 hypothetical protein [Enterococcus faecium]
MIEPIAKSVKPKRHTPQYQMHKYFARRPYNVFNNLVKHYTKENDLVLDVFCGGGVTVFESVKENRRAIGVDLNPLASFITEMQMKQVDLTALEKFFDKFLESVSYLNDYYKIDIEGATKEIEWTEWAYVIECPNCHSPILLTEENKFLKSDGKKKNGFYNCSNPYCELNLHGGVKRVAGKQIGSEPIAVKFFGEGIININKYNNLSHQIIKVTADDELQENFIYPDAPISVDWDRTNEDKLIEKGIQNFSDFFTTRNYNLNVVIFNHILDLKKDDTIDQNLVDCLYFAFSSSLRYTNKMSKVSDHWENGKPSAMDKHAYWLPNVYIESNVLLQLKNRMEAIRKGLAFTEQKISSGIEMLDIDQLLHSNSGFSVLNQSSDVLPLPDKSINAVITDPPYGSNVQYGELSAYWNIWYQQYRHLDSFIYNEKEAVMNRKKQISGFKDALHYENMLFRVFKESHRVLKDDGYLVFTFNNKDLSVWIALLRAVTKAGFVLPEEGVIFQDYIESYKNTAHLRYSGNIQGDFIYSFKKGKYEINDSLKEYEPLMYIETQISRIINQLYDTNIVYNTAELYQGIFSEIIEILCKYIAANIENESVFTTIFKKAGTILETVINRKLEFKEGAWFLRTGESTNE